MPTSRTVVVDGGSGTVTIPAAPHSSHLIVVDFITITYTPGASAEVMLATVANSIGAGMWKGAKYFDASTADTMHVDFPSGLPIWRTTTSNVNYGGASISGQLVVEVTNPANTFITVGYHYEHPAERAN